MASSTPSAARLAHNPLLLLAFGFGSGLSPRAPGTAGSALAVLLYLPLTTLSLPVYTIFIAISLPLGVLICGRASRELGVHDHGGIVFDEFVGLWISLWALPAGWLWIVAGFVLFRLFDIVKPWPISWLDRRVSGGLGIVLDDVVAGLMALILLQGAAWFMGVSIWLA